MPEQVRTRSRGREAPGPLILRSDPLTEGDCSQFLLSHYHKDAFHNHRNRALALIILKIPTFSFFFCCLLNYSACWRLPGGGGHALCPSGRWWCKISVLCTELVPPECPDTIYVLEIKSQGLSREAQCPVVTGQGMGVCVNLNHHLLSQGHGAISEIKQHSTSRCSLQGTTYYK